MTTLSNPYALAPTPEGVHTKSVARRTLTKPQQCFADAAALVGTRTQAKADKKTSEKPVADTKVCEQGNAASRKRNGRSAADSDQAVAGIASSDLPVAVPVCAKEGDAGADPAAVGIIGVASRELSAAKTRNAQTVESAMSAVAGGQSRSRGMARGQSVGASETRHEEAVTASGSAAGDTPVLHQVKQDKWQAKASNPVTTNPDHPTQPNPQEDERHDAALTSQAERAAATQKEHGVIIKQPVEGAEVPCTDSSLTAAKPAPSAPEATSPLPKEGMSTVAGKPERANPNPPVAHQDQSADMPQDLDQRLSRSGSEGQHHAAPRRQDISVREQRQTETTGSDGKSAASAQHSEVSIASVEPPATIAQPPAVAASTPVDTRPQGDASTGTTANLARTVGEQILDSLRTSVRQGDRELSIRLQPPELGTVTIRLREQGERLEGMMVVGQSETRREIEQALPEVVRSLQDSGIQIRRFEVTISDSVGQDLGRGPTPQDSWAGQHGSGQGRDHLPTPHTPWVPETANYQGHSEEAARAARRTGAAAGRIDMLL